MLKRYLAFAYSKYDYAAGGSSDVVAEADTLDGLIAACIEGDQPNIDEILDLECREWVGAETMRLFNGMVGAVYAEKHPPKPRTPSEKERDEEFMQAMMVGGEQPGTFVHYEKGLQYPLTRGLLPPPA